MNPTLAYNWQGIRDAGLVRGAYHFAQPDNSNPTAQALFFLHSLGGDIQPGDLLALDLEAGSGDVLGWTLSFLARVENEVGFKSMLYSGTWFLGPHGCLGSAYLGNYGLWLSGYQANMPPVPAGWTTLAMWQYTDQAIVPGIAGPCDQSYFLGDVDQLKQYGRPSTAQTNPLPNVADQVVTIASVIGDMTYPDGCAWDELAPNQSVTRRVFQRELVQQLKALLGA